MQYKELKLKKLIITFIICITVSGSLFALSDREELILERIKPVGEVHLLGSEVVSTSPVSNGSIGTFNAEERYNSVCTACHDTGVSGSPIVGDKASWEPRIAQGMDTLLKHAVSGLNAMPPKGLCMDCTEDQLMAIIEFMVNKSK